MLRSPPLGKILVDTGVVTQAALDEVISAQKTDKRRLGELLVDRGLVRPQQLAQLLSHQLSCPWVSLQRIDITPAVVSLLPREVAFTFHAVPVHLRVARGTKTLYIATDDPTDDRTLAECAKAAGMPVKPMVAVTADVSATLARLYGGDGQKPTDAITVHHPSSEAPPRGTPSTPPRPPPPAKSAVPPPPDTSPDLGETSIDEADIIITDGDRLSATPALSAAPMPAAPAIVAPRSPRVVVLSAPERFLQQCKDAAKTLGAEIVAGDIAKAHDIVSTTAPCAIVVTESVYASDRSGLSRTALEIDALLVVWSEDVEGRQLEPLLEGAVKRWRHSSYEKGSVVEGRYELLRDLGGRFAGSRWEVRHTRTGRRSVLKVGVRTTEDESDAQAVCREEHALSLVHHPAAVDLRDAGNTELGDPFVVVELLEGRTLEGLVAARGPLSRRDACCVALQIAELLASAHASGVHHGAVRADNVILVRDGYGVERAKLLDWEAAEVTDDRVDPANDIAGLGQCLFEALFGRKPPEDAATIEGDLPPAIARTLRKALATDPETRFSSMKAFVSALEGAEPQVREPSLLLDPRWRSPKTSIPPPSTEVPKSASEQRKAQRAPYRTPVRVEVGGRGSVDGRSEDISTGGLFLVARGDIATGTPVTVRFALPLDGKVMSEQGIVRWSRSAQPQSAGGDGPKLCAIGIELTAPSEEATRQIDRYVALMGVTGP